MKITSAIETTLVNWKFLAKERFLKIHTKGKYCTIVIKFRETDFEKSLCNEIEPFPGIRFIDVMGTGDYFLGEFIILDKKLLRPIVSTFSIVLKISEKKRKTEKIRDDGFIKVYRTTEKTMVITIV